MMNENNLENSPKIRDNNLSLTLKYVMWTFFDYVTKIIFISILWFIFNLPFIYSIYVFHFSRISSPLLYGITLIIIVYSPFSLGAAYYILQIISQIILAPKFNMFPRFPSQDFIRISVFFNGIFKYFFKSLGIILIMSLLLLILSSNLLFYWKNVVPKIPFLGYMLIGIIFWIISIVFLLNVFLLPIIIIKKISLFKAIYQSFLLVIDNLMYVIFVFLLLISFLIIMAFTMAGLFGIYFGVAALIQFISYFIIYRKYDDSIELVSESRTLKNIFKPK